ncbi:MULTISPECIES: amidohydrolase family protein [Paraburkholderia]|jgi:predicted TIM-barrel fold metal-dependent hydrolase|uniref:amidohydrolase family protein n=1 Tax=Paraburkholderia TaxID=1822464 RepID=UPI0015587777|nr:MULTISPECIES: amidohydrolase family protein [Paraburkholderia]MCX4169834.1 amidohydrolase family protein [Paraburkholderia madseniana]MDQ6457846.1 amidohydrolase [Paraburkholderia madseniana]NPT64794.1 amidohydrolase family protein [Paraburkholderia madseniana]
MPKRKIDTHQHFLPKLYVDAVGLDLLNAAMPGGVAPTWSVEAALAMMDENGIDEGILSISSGPTLPDAATLLRKCNDHAAELRTRHPGRFGSFASLPLPDIDASLKEVSYCLDVLKVDGFIVFTNYDGRYLGDEHFTPLWEELNRRGTVVFVHPNQPPHDVPSVAPASVLEFPFETTRTATSLIISGAMSRFRNIRFILSHAGGTLPFLVPRIALSISMMPAVAERVGDTLAAVRSFYFDTALSAGNAPLSALAQVADPDHILFGTDFPFAPVSAIRQFGKVLDNIHIPGIEMDKVYGDNAARLLAR